VAESTHKVRGKVVLWGMRPPRISKAPAFSGGYLSPLYKILAICTALNLNVKRYLFRLAVRLSLKTFNQNLYSYLDEEELSRGKNARNGEVVLWRKDENGVCL